MSETGTTTVETKGDDGAERVTKAVEGLLAKHGDPHAALRVLINENYTYRDQLRDLKGKLPADGAIVLDADAVKTLKAYQSLGDPKEVAKELETTRADSKTLADIRATDQLKLLAKVAGYTPEVFARLAKQDGLALVTKDDKGKDGKAVAKVFVKGDGDALTPIEHYAATHWSEFTPALKPEQAKTNATPPRHNPQPQPETTQPQPRRRVSF